MIIIKSIEKKLVLPSGFPVCWTHKLVREQFLSDFLFIFPNLVKFLMFQQGATLYPATLTDNLK